MENRAWPDGDVRAHRAERPDHDASDPDLPLDPGVLRDRGVGRDLASLDQRRLAAERSNENKHLGERRAGVGHLQHAAAAEPTGARAGRRDDDALAATGKRLPGSGPQLRGEPVEAAVFLLVQGSHPVDHELPLARHPDRLANLLLEKACADHRQCPSERRRSE
jgi:hypothetical protein